MTKEFKRAPTSDELSSFINEPINSQVSTKEKDLSVKQGVADIEESFLEHDKDVLTFNSSMPWSVENKSSVKKRVFNIRLNKYYHSALKYFSNPENGESMQIVPRRILEKGLDELISRE